MTRTAKLLPHLWHRPQDVIHVPAFILFGYYFAIMKLYALFTLHETGWGTRAGIGDVAAATAAADAGPPANEKYAAQPAYSQPAYADGPPTPTRGYSSDMAPYGEQNVAPPSPYGDGGFDQHQQQYQAPPQQQYRQYQQQPVEMGAYAQ